MATLYSPLKFMRFPDRLEALRAGRRAAPAHVRIKPTNHCNHKCWYCAYRTNDLKLGEDMNERDSIPPAKMVEIVDACVLDGKSRFIYRVAANLYHTNISLTEYVVHHGSTLGPFLGDADRVYAPFSPDGTDRNAYLRYRDEILKRVLAA